MNKKILEKTKQLAVAIFFAYSLITLPAFAETANPKQASVAAPTLPWTSDYKQAVSSAKKDAKPLFLYFTGSDWCSWCYKLDDEILTNRDFINTIKNNFVFVKIDFPIYKTLDANQTKQNEELKERFNVQGFPTIILLDNNEIPIAHLNYREGGAKAYAEYILKILKEHSDFQKGVKTLSQQSSGELQRLYKKASQLGMDEEAKIILTEGLTHEDNIFFLKEQYRFLLNEGRIATKTTENVRKELLAKDPQNKKHVHYDVAICDFEALSKNLPALKTADTVLAPLEQYLAQFGEKDTKNRWKIEMTISQVYRSKNQLDKAAQYAMVSQAHAPAYMRLDIAKLVNDIQHDNSAIAEAAEEK
jgi:protein disulfide-isomerase